MGQTTLAQITEKGYAGNKSVTSPSYLAGMKTESMVRTLPATLKGSRGLCVALLLLASMRTTNAASATELLEKGIYTEETKGELKAAIQIYRSEERRVG